MAERNADKLNCSSITATDDQGANVKLAAAAIIFIVSWPALAANSDGRWSVLLVTEQGACDVYRWQVAIQDGQVLPSANLPAQPAGGVDPRGRVDLRFVRQDDTLAAVGAIQGETGSGTWSSPSRGCFGRWQAERRGPLP